MNAALKVAPADSPQYLTDRDLAARYQVSRNTIWAWVRSGNLPAPVKLGHSCTRWNRTDIEATEKLKANGQGGVA